MSMEDVMLVPISFAVILGVFAVVSIIVLYIRGHRDRGSDPGQEQSKAATVSVGVEADVEASVQEIFLRDEETICMICLDTIKKDEHARLMELVELVARVSKSLTLLLNLEDSCTATTLFIPAASWRCASGNVSILRWSARFVGTSNRYEFGESQYCLLLEEGSVSKFMTFTT
ncbi:unnamed protein product [Durusdinium trenchii]|uniref:Uncharacterized protein n=1 Tax=Durusdinium trenchii TaxID=1381693 RepID=A0ABP0NQC6_9DINO